MVYDVLSLPTQWLVAGTLTWVPDINTHTWDNQFNTHTWDEHMTLPMPMIYMRPPEAEYRFLVKCKQLPDKTR